MLTFADLFNCKTCCGWYLRDEEGPAWQLALSVTC
jgi:hypothetical protein